MDHYRIRFLEVVSHFGHKVLDNSLGLRTENIDREIDLDMLSGIFAETRVKNVQVYLIS